ncbi:MAG: triphosphoribosyl-dephospho-CoA synthase CitG [Liquorilactobacillus mali]|uniref:triphosphoribosyl-dephospho-CoA synthase CitG n=1 Tax=Liquorilactobacillus mali TaxID=1618 RepID=UPI0039EB450B
MDFLAGGQEIGLNAVLETREWRQNYQESLEMQFPNEIVIGVKLNIPGPIKTSIYLKKMFLDGWKELLEQLRAASHEILFLRLFLDKQTGPEGMLVVTGKINQIKQLTILFESSFLFGRLFDADVMSQNGDEYQLSRTQLGFEARRCLVCGRNAKFCAKEQRHTLNEIYRAIQKLIDEDNQKSNNMGRTEDLAEIAVTALLYEVVTNPKPGLVDPASNGAHKDMDVFTFIESAQSLRSYFHLAQEIGFEFAGNSLPEMFNQLRRVGVEAERKMFHATNGVNTHKGAIFSLGIFVCATAYLQKNGVYSQSTLTATIKAMLINLLQNDFKEVSKKPKDKLSAGEFQFLKYKTMGIRGEAAAGYPAVFDLALPFLKSTKGNINERLLNTLMYIAGHASDSNLIKRAQSLTILDEMKSWSARFFELGGSQTVTGIQFLNELDEVFKRRNLSLGGSADLLILTIFAGRIEGII